AAAERTLAPAVWRKCSERLASSAAPSRGPSGEGDALVADAILGDLIAHGAAPVLDHAEEAADAVADPLAAHDEDGVGDGPNVAGRHLARDEVLELCLLGGNQEHGGDPGVVVAMGVDELPVAPHGQADLHAERLAVAVDHLPIEVVEEVRL